MNDKKCVYLITNNLNGKKYVGVAEDFKKRMYQHKIGHDAGHSYIDRAILKYGWENFTCEIIDNYETLEERKHGRTKEGVENQLLSALEGIDDEDVARIIFAYEPIWAVGTGKTPTAADVEEVHAAIRKALAKKLGKATANKMRILYGGSVKPSNAAELLALPDVDGALIGGASLKVEDFIGIAKNACSK